MTFGFHYWYFWHLAIAHSMEDPGSTPLVVRKLLPGQAIMLLVSSAYKMLRKAKCSAFLINGLKIVKPGSFLIPLIKNISTLQRTEKINADKPPAKTPAKNPRIQAPTFLLILLCLSFFTGTTTVLGPGAWAYLDLDSGAIAGLCRGLVAFSARIWYSVKEFVVLEGQLFELRKPPNGRRQSTLQPSCMGSQEHCAEQGCLSLFGQAKEHCDQ
uniref:Uncharacterized protein n=1 Tax=Solanum lycopersicum TaxID=4081 RepID=A0A3Q7FP14_SOLLC